MRLRIQGREYDVIDPRSCRVLHLMELRQQTRGLVEGGLGLRELGPMARRMQAAHEEQAAARAQGVQVDDDALDVDPDEVLIWLAVLVFLARRAAGERVSFADAADISPDEIEMVSEPGDEEDPQVPTSAGDADAGQPAG